MILILNMLLEREVFYQFSSACMDNDTVLLLGKLNKLWSVVLEFVVGPRPCSLPEMNVKELTMNLKAECLYSSSVVEKKSLSFFFFLQSSQDNHCFPIH